MGIIGDTVLESIANKQTQLVNSFLMFIKKVKVKVNLVSRLLVGGEINTETTTSTV